MEDRNHLKPRPSGCLLQVTAGPFSSTNPGPGLCVGGTEALNLGEKDWDLGHTLSSPSCLG